MMNGPKFMVRLKPFKPNHAEIFGLMREYGPPQIFEFADDLEREEDGDGE